MRRRRRQCTPPNGSASVLTVLANATRTRTRATGTARGTATGQHHAALPAQPAHDRAGRPRCAGPRSIKNFALVSDCLPAQYQLKELSHIIGNPSTEGLMVMPRDVRLTV